MINTEIIGEPNDAFWLAQAYFLMADYHRAETILTSKLPSPKLPHSHASYDNDNDNGLAEGDDEAAPMASPKPAGVHLTSTRYLRNRSPTLSVHLKDASQRQRQREDNISSLTGGLWRALERPSDSYIGKLNTGADNRIEGESTRGAMIDWSMACRYLATLCLVRISLENSPQSADREAVASRQVDRRIAANWGDQSICNNRYIESPITLGRAFTNATIEIRIESYGDSWPHR